MGTFVESKRAGSPDIFSRVRTLRSRLGTSSAEAMEAAKPDENCRNALLPGLRWRTACHPTFFRQLGSVEHAVVQERTKHTNTEYFGRAHTQSAGFDRGMDGQVARGKMQGTIVERDSATS